MFLMFMSASTDVIVCYFFINVKRRKLKKPESKHRDGHKASYSNARSGYGCNKRGERGRLKEKNKKSNSRRDVRNLEEKKNELQTIKNHYRFLSREAKKMKPKRANKR